MFEAPTTPEIPGLASISLPTEDADAIRFLDSETRTDDMHTAAAAWFEKIATAPDEQQTVYLIDRWLDVAANLFDFSAKNTVLLSLQDPNARFAIDYDTWNEDHDVRIDSGAGANFLWDSVIEPMCPECGNGPTRHKRSECEYSETHHSEWEVGLVGFAPSPVFTSEQTQSGQLPMQRRLWDSIDAEDAATTIRDTIADYGSFYGITPIGSEPIPESEREESSNSTSTTDGGTAVLNLTEGVANPSTTAESTGPSIAPLVTTPETDLYNYRAALEVPTDESPSGDAVAASVRQLAMAILTGNTNDTSAPDHITPDKHLDTIDSEARKAEAELVAHLVARRTGIDPPRDLSEAPIGDWFGESHREICTRFDRILSTADFIIGPVDRRAHAAKNDYRISDATLPEQNRNLAATSN